MLCFKFQQNRIIIEEFDFFDWRGGKGQLFINFNSSKPNSDCNCAFPFDLAPNRIPFGAKPIGKV